MFGRNPFAVRVLLLTCITLPAAAPGMGSPVVRYVIHVSVDGLRPDAITNLGPTYLPNFYRMRTQGAFTDNARTDYDFTVTLPNHATQFTGRGVMGPTGHNWMGNSDPPEGHTLHTNKGSYVAGAYDVAHDNGLRTGLYASKTKFSLFDTSWDDVNGAPDTTGPDDGRDKIDVYAYHRSTGELTGMLLADATVNPFHYVLLHLADPDTVGHASGWDPSIGSPYSDAIIAMDARLGQILRLADHYPPLIGRTAVILTSDHGGVGWDHSDPTRPENYTIPFYVWGPGVQPGADLYALNAGRRLDPGAGRPPYCDPVQPIRNGEAANLALQLLGLGPVPESTLNAGQDLIVPEPATLTLLAVALLATVRRRRG